MPYSSRIWLYGPIILLLTLAAIVCAYWFIAASRLSQTLEQINGQEVVPGLVLRYAQPEIGGFPFRLDAVFQNFRATVQGAHGPVEWQSENLALHRLTYGAQTLFEAAGTQSVQWNTADGKTQLFSFTPGIVQASAIFDGTGLSRFDLDIIGIQSSGLNGQRLQLHVRRNPDRPDIDVVLAADDLRFLQAQNPAFGASLKKARVQATLSQSASFDAFRSGTMDWRMTLDQWSTDQGGVDPVEFSAQWENAKLSGKAQFLLDGNHRPQGTGTLTLTGLSALTQDADASDEQTDLPSRAAQILLEKAKAESLNGSISQSITAKDGILFVGQTPAATLGSLY